jgi:hypothetical protein
VPFGGRIGVVDPVEWVADDDEEILDSAPIRRRPRRWITGLLLAAAVVAAVSIGVAVHRHNRPDAAAPPRPHRGVSSSVPTPVPASPSGRHPVVPRSTVRRTGFPLLGVRTGWELFGRGAGVVVRIQLARGRITTTPIPPLASSGPVSFVVSGPDALVRPFDAVPGYVVPDGKPGRTAPGALGAAGPVLPGPRPGQFWAPQGRTRVVLVDGRGRQLSPRISIRIPPDGYPQPDGTGYVLVQTLHGSYDARPDGRTLITRGQLLAAGATGWLTADCRATRCRYSVVDATGSRRVLHVHSQPGALRVSSPGAISPDGSRAALLTTAGRVALVDLTTGTVTTAGPRVDVEADTQPEGQIAWSPDSRWLVALRAGGLFAIRTPPEVGPSHHPAPSVLTLGVRLPDLLQIAIQPAARASG